MLPLRTSKGLQNNWQWDETLGLRTGKYCSNGHRGWGVRRQITAIRAKSQGITPKIPAKICSESRANITGLDGRILDILVGLLVGVIRVDKFVLNLGPDAVAMDLL